MLVYRPWLSARPDLAPWAPRWGRLVTLAQGPRPRAAGWERGLGLRHPLPGAASGREPPSPARGPSLAGSGQRRAEGLSFAPAPKSECFFLPGRTCVCVWPRRGMHAPTLNTCQAPASGFGSRVKREPRGPGVPRPVGCNPCRRGRGAQAGPGLPHTRLRAEAGDSPLSRRPAASGDPEKFARAAPRLGPGISIVAPAPLPSASPWRLLEVGGGKQTRRKAKYYECSWGDLRGVGDRRA